MKKGVSVANKVALVRESAAIVCGVVLPGFPT